MTVDERVWQGLAHLSPAELHCRIMLGLSILRSRLPETPDRLCVERALEGWSIDELIAGEVGR